MGLSELMAAMSRRMPASLEEVACHCHLAINWLAKFRVVVQRHGRTLKTMPQHSQAYAVPNCTGLHIETLQKEEGILFVLIKESKSWVLSMAELVTQE